MKQNEIKGLEGFDQLLTDERIIYVAEGCDHKKRVYLYDSVKFIGNKKQELAIATSADNLYMLLVRAAQHIKYSDTEYPCDVNCTELERLLTVGYGIYFSKVGEHTVAAVASSNEFDDPDPLQLQIGNTVGESFSKLVALWKKPISPCLEARVTTYRKTL